MAGANTRAKKKMCENCKYIRLQSNYNPKFWLILSLFSTESLMHLSLAFSDFHLPCFEINLLSTLFLVAAVAALGMNNPSL